MKRVSLYLFLGVSVVGILYWYTFASQALTQIVQSVPQTKISSLKYQWKPQTVTIAFVGDLMLHGRQIKSAYRSDIQEYDFSEYFESLHDELVAYDYLVGNLETPVAGSSFGYGAYPLFNAPVNILTNLRDAGFDMLQVANNHLYDRGYDGLTSTMNNIQEIGFDVIGYEKVLGEPEPTILNFDDIRVAFISGTYGFNTSGNSTERQSGITTLSGDAILDMIAQSIEQRADVIIVAPHWGVEYARVENQEQIDLAKAWIDAGADVIVGTHPHVVEPLREITTESGRKGIVAYSLGNFVSNQQDKYTDLGAIFTLTLTKNSLDEPTSIADYGLSYLYNYQDTKMRPGYTNYTVYRLPDVPVEILNQTQQSRIDTYRTLTSY